MTGLQKTFSFDVYRSLIRRFIEREYRVVPLIDTSRTHSLILRHDVEIELEAAARMAAVESDMGVVATYFVALSSPMFGTESAAFSRAIAAIAGCGHSLGIHLTPQEALDIQSGRLVLPDWVSSPPAASLHSPGPVDQIDTEYLSLVRPVYEPIQRGRWIYISDSAGTWGHGDPLETAAFHEGRSIQLLTHPFWWTGGSGTPLERMERLRERTTDRASAQAFFPRLYGQAEGRPGDSAGRLRG